MLGLRHGGVDDVNFKPNYLSVMNYWFQFIGTFNGRQRSFDYSRRTLVNLDEANLNENAGISDPDQHRTLWNKLTRQDIPAGSNKCIANPNGYFRLFLPGPALDFDCDGTKTVAAVNADVNGDGICVAAVNTLDLTVRGDDLLVKGDAPSDVDCSGGCITAGPNHTCDSVASGDDLQVQNVGDVQPTLFVSFNDWPALAYDGGGQLGPSNSLTSRKVRTQRETSTQRENSTQLKELPMARIIYALPPPSSTKS